VEAHIEHAEGFVIAAAGTPPTTAVDLGSGGGVPGLVLALRWPASSWTLVDSAERRCRFLEEASVELGLARRVRVAQGRAEVLGRDAALRGAFGLVTARSFGPPSVTAECAAPFLEVGGSLLVSEPPASAPRWPDEVAVFGLAVGERVSGIQVLTQIERCPDRFPRRTGVPGKRPLF
jgi:16S rRNA (guanine527-N7)-methyltransferase